MHPGGGKHRGPERPTGTERPPGHAGALRPDRDPAPRVSADPGAGGQAPPPARAPARGRTGWQRPTLASEKGWTVLRKNEENAQNASAADQKRRFPPRVAGSGQIPPAQAPRGPVPAGTLFRASVGNEFRASRSAMRGNRSWRAVPCPLRGSCEDAGPLGRPRGACRRVSRPARSGLLSCCSRGEKGRGKEEHRLLAWQAAPPQCGRPPQLFVCRSTRGGAGPGPGESIGRGCDGELPSREACGTLL